MAQVTMAQANRAVRNLPADVAREVSAEAGATAQQVATLARARVPVSARARHGIHLRDAISWALSGKTGAVVRVAALAIHWKFLEFGTVKMPAIGMFRAAGDQARPDHKRRVFSALRRAHERLTRSGT